MKTESEKRKLVYERLIKLSHRAMDSRGRFEKAYEKAIAREDWGTICEERNIVSFATVSDWLC